MLHHQAIELVVRPSRSNTVSLPGVTGDEEQMEDTDIGVQGGGVEENGQVLKSRFDD